MSRNRSRIVQEWHNFYFIFNHTTFQNRKLEWTKFGWLSRNHVALYRNRPDSSSYSLLVNIVRASSTQTCRGFRFYSHFDDFYRPQRSWAKAILSQASVILSMGVVCSRGQCLLPGGYLVGGCLVWGCLVLGCLVQGVPGPGGGCLVETFSMATAAGSTHPTGMHCCFVMQNQITFVMQNQRWLPEDDYQRSLHFYTNIMVMAPLSIYSIISAPLGLTLGSECVLETVKCDLLLKSFYSVQNS